MTRQEFIVQLDSFEKTTQAWLLKSVGILVGGTAAYFGLLALAGLWRQSTMLHRLAVAFPAAALLIAFFAWMFTLHRRMDRLAGRLGLRCAHCGKCLNGTFGHIVVATGHCGHCGGRILEDTPPAPSCPPPPGEPRASG